MARAKRVCPTRDCFELTDGGRCPTCKRRAEQVRGTPAQRGYAGPGHAAFRSAVLRRDPRCVCTDQTHGHAVPCPTPSRHADHHPMSRRELVAAGLDPNDPAYGRGLCGPCHSRETAANPSQRGGWNQR